ncbi:MAG TPA: hypothetical protein VGG84_09810, partial [Gemmatimonadaceae bacterium]
MTRSARALVLILGCARVLGGQTKVHDTTFVLAARTPDRWPGPYIGNGHLGGIITATGIGAMPVLVAGLYEEAPGDVPRITSIPAWNVVDLFDGARWLSAQAATPAALQQYVQTLDMYAGTVHTTYDWVDGDRRMSVEVDQLISRADPHLAAVRVRVVPRFAGRVRIAFPLTAWPPPRRLPLAQVERYDPAWGPKDTWYPGHVTIRSRRAALTADGGEVSLDGTPDGRTTMVAQLAAVAWPHGLPGAVADTTVVGDSAAVSLSFDAAAGRRYTFTKFVGNATSLEGADPASRAATVARVARAHGYEAVRAASAAAWAQRWKTDIEITGHPELQRIVRAMLFQ